MGGARRGREERGVARRTVTRGLAAKGRGVERGKDKGRGQLQAGCERASRRDDREGAITATALVTSTGTVTVIAALVPARVLARDDVARAPAIAQVGPPG